MAVKTKRGLGRGLDSLIPAGESKKEVKKATVIVKEEKALESDESKKLIKITKVEPNHDQPRKQFD
jgi:ParB family chromosome partitioning protein